MKLLRGPIRASDRIPDRFFVISMEFLSLSRRRSYSQNVPQRRWARRNVCRSQANSQARLSRLESLSIWPWMFLKFCLNGKHPRSQLLKWLFLHVIFCRMLDAFSRCLGMYCSLETWLFLYSLKNEQEWHIIGFKNSWLRLEFFTW